MSPLEAILKIKAMFAEAGVEVAAAEPAVVDPAAMPVEQSKEYQLKSGVTVVIDKLEVGGKVDIKAEDGSLSPAPAGEHELADGSIIVLDEAASIVEVKMPEVKEEVEVEIEAKDAEKKKEEEMYKEKIAKMEEELAMMKKKQAEMEAAAAKFEAAIPQLTDIVIGLMNTPSAEPTEAPKDKFGKHVESHTDKVSKFLELAKSIKK